MPRPRRRFRPRCSYHVTVRCNNRAFDLRSREARAVVLDALRRSLLKYSARLHGVALMSNHVHYLLKTENPSDLPRLMQWLNWYTAITLNRLLGRTGHFWEARYHAVPVPDGDQRHVLNVLRYIHGNPYAAGASPGLRDEFTNYGSHSTGEDDGLTTLHPQFLRLGGTLRECSIRYRRFCRQYRPIRKPGPSPRSANWGRRILAGVRSEMDRKRRFASKPKTRDHDQSLFTPARRPEARTVRDDSPAQQRPKWVSAVKSPLRGGVPSAVADGLIAAGTAPPAPRCFDSAATVAVPETTPRSPWLVDPIREHCRRFWRINGLRRGTIDDVPLA